MRKTAVNWPAAVVGQENTALTNSTEIDGDLGLPPSLSLFLYLLSPICCFNKSVFWWGEGRQVTPDKAKSSKIDAFMFEIVSTENFLNA